MTSPIVPVPPTTVDPSIFALVQHYYGFGYTYPLTAVSGTSEVALILLNNTSAGLTSKTMYSIYRKALCGTSGQSATLRFYSNPTATVAGTAQTVHCTRVNANSPASIIVVTTGPTITVNGTLVGELICGGNASDAANYEIGIDPGNSLLVTVQVSQTAALAGVDLSWIEM